MTSTIVALLSLALQSTPPAAAQTPQDCVKAARDFTSRRMKELGPPTTGNVRTLNEERLAMLRECAGRFDVDATPVASLGPLIELLTEAQQPELARKSLARALADASLGTAEKGRFLALAVRLLLREPKGPERNAAAEKYVDQLDALGAEAFEHQMTAHGLMNGYYRADDIDAGIIRHSTWMIEKAATFSPELRKRYGNVIVNAYDNLAQALSGQGENDRALAMLEQATTRWSDVADVARITRDTLARAMMIGKPAPAITAPTWLNRADASAVPLTGKVTLLQFTAHWCGPCKESYPGMKRLEDRFGKDQFQVVFYTRTYGYFGADRDLTPAQEIERDKTYYAGYGFTLPIAIGPPASVTDAVESAYEVSGIPQINVIDKKGNIRRVMIGYDDANEEKLAAFIQELLREK
jgi:thiol-disulfide isomerase/thioredoxin